VKRQRVKEAFRDSKTSHDGRRLIGTRFTSSVLTEEARNGGGDDFFYNDCRLLNEDEGLTLGKSGNRNRLSSALTARGGGGDTEKTLRAADSSP